MDMGRWTLENRAWQQILTHYCDHTRSGDSNQVLRQDIGGGYIRCERCGGTFLPELAPGNPRLLLRVLRNDTPDDSRIPNKDTSERAATPLELVHS